MENQKDGLFIGSGLLIRFCALVIVASHAIRDKVRCCGTEHRSKTRMHAHKHTHNHTSCHSHIRTHARTRSNAHASTRTQPMKRCKPCACTLSSASWHSPLPSCRCAVLLMVESKLSRPLALSFSHPRHLSFSLFLTYPSSSREACSLSLSSVVASASHKLAPTLTFFLGPSSHNSQTRAHSNTFSTLLFTSLIFCDALVRQECQRLGFELQFGLDTFNPT